MSALLVGYSSILAYWLHKSGLLVSSSLSRLCDLETPESTSSCTPWIGYPNLMSIATIQSPIFNFFGIDLSLSESVKHPPNTRHPQVDFRESYDRIIVLQLMVSLRNPRRDHLQKGLDQLDDTKVIVRPEITQRYYNNRTNNECKRTQKQRNQ